MRKNRLWIVLAVLCLLLVALPVVASAGWVDEYGDMYYYLDNGDPAEDFLQIDGTWYYFYESGLMAKNAAVWSDDYNGNYALSPDGKQHKRLNNGWTQAYGEWYYVDDGYCVRDEIRKIDGVYYAFDWDGKMLDGELAWIDGTYCAAKKGGALYTNSWYQDNYDGEWYYFGKDARGVEDFVKVSGKWYYFSCGWMAKDMGVYSYVDDAFYALSPDGESYKRLNKGWTKAYGEWYYLVEETDGSLYLPYEETLKIGGHWYFFGYDCKMLANDKVYTVVDGIEGYYVANADGILSDSGWYSSGGNWYYVLNGGNCEFGIYEIDGNLYGFDSDGRLYTLGGSQWIDGFNIYGDWIDGEYYVTDGSGVLYRNKWRNRQTGHSYEVGWVYYGEDGRLLYDAIIEIDGVLYIFDDYGVMQTDTILARYDEGIYIVDGSGVASKMKSNTWYQDKASGDWYRTDANGYPAEDILKIDGKYYGFYGGRMVTESYCYGTINGIRDNYLFDANGNLVTKKGWVQEAGEWYYVDSDGSLYYGWLTEGGTTYYLWPEMCYDRLVMNEDTGELWYANGKGHCTKTQFKNGLNVYEGCLFYIENNCLVTGEWRKIDGYWYYFSDGGAARVNGFGWVDGDKYYFDENGRMMTGWIARYSSWYYAGSDGKLVTGLQTIGGKQYLFDSEGQMLSGGIWEWDGVFYLIDNGGVIKHTFSGTGWKQIGGNWYYCENGDPYTNTVRKIGQYCYAFDDEGVMLSGGVHYTYWDYYNIGADGKILTGWMKINGKWAYADPYSDDPFLCTGWREIDGKGYIFDEDGFLMIGNFTYAGSVVTTDSDGAVVSEVPAKDGWYHYDNNWYYTVDGYGYTGWVDGCFCEYGRMYFCEIVEYNGNLYYLKADGSCLKNGWAEYEGSWILARADGSLYCTAWAQQGKNWYYFDYIYMVTGINHIDGKDQYFDENGVWQYEIKTTTNTTGYDAPKGLADGTWYQNKSTGKWYYYHNGEPVSGLWYIGGECYFFNYKDRTMVTNGFATYKYDYGNRLLCGYYFGADGAAAHYTGWKYLKGQWYYFDATYQICLDQLLRDGSGYYFAYWDDEDGYTMLKNTGWVMNNQLYIFDRNGLAKGVTTANGWHQAGGQWYYIENGTPAKGYRVIGGVGYYFDYDGSMLVSDYAYANGQNYYFGSNGAKVTTQGWYQTFYGEWVYVGASGAIYENGIYFIGGVQYTFRYGIWVS